MKLAHITKRYGSKTVFEDFSLDIAEGEILCILGPSGCGKTTLLNILAGLLPFDGEAEIPSPVSYAFQEPRLLSNLTVKSNLLYAGGKEEYAEDLLAFTELLEYADQYPSKLSGGERQRVSLARAFCVPFSLLLMDEPFSSLDTALKLRLVGHFARLWKERRKEGAAAVLVTHDIEEALMLADRAIVLKNGKVAADVRMQRERFPAPYAAPSKERELLLQALLD